MSTYIQYLEGHSGTWFLLVAVIAASVIVMMKSVRNIGPTEVGLVRKRFSVRKLHAGNAIAFDGEAGYQARLMMPGVQFKLWPLYDVTRHPMVQIPAGQIGVVIAQVGRVASQSAPSRASTNPNSEIFWISNRSSNGGGEKGVQRLVLPPGTVVPIHPVGFLVITRDTVYGVPIDEKYAALEQKGGLKPQSFGLEPVQLEVVRIEPRFYQDGKGRRHDRHRHDLRGTAPAQGRDRQPHRRFRRSGGAGSKSRRPRTANWSKRSFR